jgi:hypothetical protein
MVAERLKELAGMLMIGDGVLALVEPRGHALLWRRGPAAWRWMIDPFVERPALTRSIGAVEAVLGLWLATRQASRARLENAAPSVATFAETDRHG